MSRRFSLTARARSRLAADTLVTAGASLASVAISAVASVIIARRLGVTGRGQWAAISALAVLVGTIATVGVPAAAGFAAVRLSGADRSRLSQAAFAAAAVLAVLAAAAYAMISLLVAPRGVSREVILLGAVISAALVLYQVAHQLVLTTSPLIWFGAGQVLPALALLAGVLVVGSSLDVAVVTVMAAAGSLLGAAVSTAGCLRQGSLGDRLLIRSARDAQRVLRPHVSFALLTFATLALSQVVQRLDILLVNGFRGPREAGLYAVSAQIGDVLLVVPAALGFIVFRLGATSTAGHWTQTIAAVRATAATSLLGAAVVGVAAPQLIARLFGTAYSGSVEPLRWLLPGIVLLGVQSVISNYLASRGRPRSVLVAWLTAAVVGVGLDLFVIPVYGISGAAVVSSISYIVVLGLHLRAFAGSRPRDTGGRPVILCFAGDVWDGNPHSRHHLMRRFSRSYDVLFVEGIAMRAIAGGDRHEWRRVWRKVRAFRELRTVAPGLHVLRPFPVPPLGSVGRRLQLAGVALEIRRARRRLGLDGPTVAWFSLPNVAPLLGRLGARGTLFYYQDRYDAFSHVDDELLRRDIAALARGCDVCVCTAEPLVADLRALGADPVLVRHGIDPERFAGDFAVPADLAGLERPLIGCVGLIDDHLWVEAIRAVADSLERGTVVFVGAANTDTAPLAHPRIALLGRRPYEAMPEYIAAFDCCLVPFAMNRLTEGVNPIKLREYLAAGRPVVSTALPEVLPYAGVVELAASPAEFVAAVRRALAPSGDTAAARRARRERVAGESWDAAAERIDRLIRGLIEPPPGSPA
jgi:O-antigen/teichoic acid export membrane protein/glycosyltransferase involved in cell wall biosynthesis